MNRQSATRPVGELTCRTQKHFVLKKNMGFSSCSGLSKHISREVSSNGTSKVTKYYDKGVIFTSLYTLLVLSFAFSDLSFSDFSFSSFSFVVILTLRKSEVVQLNFL